MQGGNAGRYQAFFSILHPIFFCCWAVWAIYTMQQFCPDGVRCSGPLDAALFLSYRRERPNVSDVTLLNRAQHQKATRSFNLPLGNAPCAAAARFQEASPRNAVRLTFH